MKFLEVLKSVHSRLIRKRLIEIVIVACALFSNFALLAYLLDFLGWQFSASVVAVCVLLVIFFAWRRRFFSMPQKIEAAQALDQHISSKDRNLALIEFYKSEQAGIVKDTRAELIEEQLKKKMAGFSLSLIVPFTLSTRLKGFVAGVPLSLGILLLLLYLSSHELIPEVQRYVNEH